MTRHWLYLLPVMVLSVANAVTGVTPQDSTDDLRAKADQGDPISQFELGSAYETGLHGLPQDGVEAARWYRLAAEQELVLAQYRLGLLYANGASRFGHAEGVRWLRLAADQGLADAQYNLGVMYANGRGVPRDDAEAVRLLNLAAGQQYANAQYGLGLMYADGRGVPKNDAEAVHLFRLASRQGPVSYTHLALPTNREV